MLLYTGWFFEFGSLKCVIQTWFKGDAVKMQRLKQVQISLHFHYWKQLRAGRLHGAVAASDSIRQRASQRRTRSTLRMITTQNALMRTVRWWRWWWCYALVADVPRWGRKFEDDVTRWHAFEKVAGTRWSRQAVGDKRCTAICTAEATARTSGIRRLWIQTLAALAHSPGDMR